MKYLINQQARQKSKFSTCCRLLFNFHIHSFSKGIGQKGNAYTPRVLRG